MLLVRKWLTEILMEVTSNEIHSIASDVLFKAKTRTGIFRHSFWVPFLPILSLPLFTYDCRRNLVKLCNLDFIKTRQDQTFLSLQLSEQTNTKRTYSLELCFQFIRRFIYKCLVLFISQKCQLRIKAQIKHDTLVFQSLLSNSNLHFITLSYTN